MSVRLEFEGGRELERALGQLGTRFRRKKAARDALKEAAEPILGAYKAGTHVETGMLVESEVVGTRLTRRQSMLNRSGKMPVEVYVGTADPAGIMEEFGTINQPAHPALRPAWDRLGGRRALSTIAAAMWKQIERQVRLQVRAIARGRR